jgi:hypothetical protein
MIRLGRGTRLSSLNLHPKTNHKRVSSHSGTPLGVGTSHGHFDTLDSPRPELGGSHHLPPYSILCSSPRELHPNGTFSRDSQVGVPKLSRVGVPELWELISPDRRVWSRRGLNQSYSSLRELSNDMSHSRIRCREEVDSRLLVVGSQTGNLTPGPSFAHNLGYICPNDQCEAILDIYTSRPFQWHQEHPNARCFGLFYWTLNIQESQRTPSPQLWECEFHPHTWPKWGCDTQPCKPGPWSQAQG